MTTLQLVPRSRPQATRCRRRSPARWPRLFRAAELAETIRAAGLKLGTATSVRAALWDAAEVYPAAKNPELLVPDEQRHALSLFSTTTLTT